MTAFMRGIRTPVWTTSTPSACKDGVEGRRVADIPVADQELHPGVGVVEVHDHVPGELGDPGCGRARRCAEDPHASGGVLDDSEDVQGRTGQCLGLEEVGGDDGLRLGAQEARPGSVAPVGRGVDAVFVEDVPHGGGGDLDAESGEFAVDAPATLVPRG
jgi:hypothetical protein